MPCQERLSHLQSPPKLLKTIHFKSSILGGLNPECYYYPLNNVIIVCCCIVLCVVVQENNV